MWRRTESLTGCINSVSCGKLKMETETILAQIQYQIQVLEMDNRRLRESVRMLDQRTKNLYEMIREFGLGLDMNGDEINR